MLLVASRCWVEAVAFAALAALVYAGTAPRGPMPLVSTTVLVFGAGLVLVAVLREGGRERRSATVLVVTLLGSIVWGVAQPFRDADWFAVLSRVVGFGLVGEAYLWRLVSISRGSTRWTDARNAVPLMAVAIAAAALLPGPIDRTPLAGLALLAVAASGLAL
ncbi:MAG TPA: hypothetical protein VJQ09_00030, partial [Candidatus Limnocylindria bacterium]|nr:hypothetical protein [Candidatus Limnocylindria bacterium]